MSLQKDQPSSRPTEVVANERFHSLDAYRAVAMLGGVVIHAAMAYTYPEINIWPVENKDGSFAFTLMLFGMHAFRLQAFFMMAGFFSGLLIEKRGFLEFCKNRVLRIALPLAIGSITLIPLVQAMFVWGYERRGYGGEVKLGLLTESMPEYHGTVSEFFMSGRAVEGFHWFHLWFLWYLWVIYCLYAFGHWLVTKYTSRNSQNPSQTKDDNSKDRRVSKWMMVFLPLILALPTAVLMLPMKLWQVDSPMIVAPEWDILAYYLFFFLFGRWMYNRREWMYASTSATWWYLGIGTFVALPAMLMTQMFGPQDLNRYTPGLEFPALVIYSTFTWLMVLGFLGLFVKYFARPRPWIQYTSQTAYWQYLAHIPPIILLQMWLEKQPVPIAIKFSIVVVLCYLLMFLSYHFLVRRTWIGVLLNGRRL